MLPNTIKSEEQSSITGRDKNFCSHHRLVLSSTLTFGCGGSFQNLLHVKMVAVCFLRSWELLISWKISGLLCYSKSDCRGHKSLSSDRTLSHFNIIHILTPYCTEDNLCVIFPSTTRYYGNLRRNIACLFEAQNLLIISYSEQIPRKEMQFLGYVDMPAAGLDIICICNSALWVLTWPTHLYINVWLSTTRKGSTALEIMCLTRDTEFKLIIGHFIKISK